MENFRAFLPCVLQVMPGKLSQGRNFQLVNWVMAGRQSHRQIEGQKDGQPDNTMTPVP